MQKDFYRYFTQDYEIDEHSRSLKHSIYSVLLELDKVLNNNKLFFFPQPLLRCNFYLPQDFFNVTNDADWYCNSVAQPRKIVFEFFLDCALAESSIDIEYQVIFVINYCVVSDFTKPCYPLRFANLVIDKEKTKIIDNLSISTCQSIIFFKELFKYLQLRKFNIFTVNNSKDTIQTINDLVNNLSISLDRTNFWNI